MPTDRRRPDESAGKRLNPIKRKQMEDRVHDLEGEINRLEDAIADYEAALQTFVSAEETQRLTQELGRSGPNCKAGWRSGRSWAKLSRHKIVQA